MSRRTTALIIAAVAILAFLSIAYAVREPELGATNVADGRKNIEAFIDARGPDRAYAALKEKYSDADFDLGHAAAHLFGEVLYERAGTSGVATCDAALNFGCYHGLFAAAVRAEGLRTIAALDSGCASALGPRSAACQHGIGHGIVEHLGYGEDDLLPALRACEETNQPDPLQGCTSGVFMAYNVPIVASVDGGRVPPRALDEVAGPYAPCPDLPEEAWRVSCYQQLPHWWTRVLEYDFGDLGSLCAALNGEDARACFSGVAKMAAALAEYSVEQTESSCSKMPGEWYDACIVTAAWAFDAVEMTEDGATLCRFGSPEAQSLCPPVS